MKRKSLIFLISLMPPVTQIKRSTWTKTCKKLRKSLRLLLKRRKISPRKPRGKLSLMRMMRKSKLLGAFTPLTSISTMDSHSTLLSFLQCLGLSVAELVATTPSGNGPLTKMETNNLTTMSMDSLLWDSVLWLLCLCFLDQQYANCTL